MPRRSVLHADKDAGCRLIASVALPFLLSVVDEKCPKIQYKCVPWVGEMKDGWKPHEVNGSALLCNVMPDERWKVWHNTLISCCLPKCGRRHPIDFGLDDTWNFDHKWNWRWTEFGGSIALERMGPLPDTDQTVAIGSHHLTAVPIPDEHALLIQNSDYCKAVMAALGMGVNRIPTAVDMEVLFWTLLGWQGGFAKAPDEHWMATEIPHRTCPLYASVKKYLKGECELKDVCGQGGPKKFKMTYCGQPACLSTVPWMEKAKAMRAGDAELICHDRGDFLPEGYTASGVALTGLRLR